MSEPTADDLTEFEDEFEGRDDDAGDGYDLDDETGSALFPGDASTLSYEQRHTLNLILKNPFLSAATHPAQWRTLLDDTAAIVSRLHDLFLTLEIDREREIALKRPVTNPGGERFPTLFYDSRLSREETIVAIFLRSRYHAERGSGQDRVFVDTGDIQDFAEQLRPATATDVTGDRRRVSNAIEQVRKSGILVRTREEDRFEVSAAIELLLPMTKLEAVLADLRRRNSGAGDETEPTPDPDPAVPVDLGHDGSQQLTLEDEER